MGPRPFLLPRMTDQLNATIDADPINANHLEEKRGGTEFIDLLMG
jgi:hypothetical protein